MTISPAEMPERIHQQSVQMIENFREHVAECRAYGGPDLTDMDERLLFEAWAIQKIAALQVFVVELQDQLKTKTPPTKLATTKPGPVQDDGALLPFNEAQAYLHTTRNALKLAVGRREIEFVRIGRQTLFTRAGLQRYLASRMTVPLEKRWRQR